MSPTIDDVRAAAAQLAATRATTVQAAADLAAKADAALGAARAAAALGDDSAATQARSEATATWGDRRTALAGLGGLDDQLASLIATVPGDACDLEADVPLALLPVRLETRYAAGGATLRVRIYPDDLHVDRLDRGVSPEEQAAGLAFWTALQSGTSTADAAWQTLRQIVHPDRAAWVAAALTPVTPPAVAVDPGPRQRRPAVARGLPDRFVVAAYQGAQVATAVGNPVPAEVVVGLPPDADPDNVAVTGGVVLGPGMAWMTDPGEAARIGLLVDVPLAVPGAPVDRVLAVGVRASLDPVAGAAELERILEGHRYVTGAAFVPPGTPTNNTETDRTAWTARPDPATPPTGPAAPIDPASDAGVLAAALGIDPTVPAELPYADGRDQPLAAAANTVLWQPTWGGFLERLITVTPDGASIGDATREAWRDYWQDHVRGRGPLPLLRVGDQPYGFLPASAVHRRWQADTTSAFEAALLDVLRRARSLVSGGLGGVPSVGGPGPLDDVLLEILGSAPHLLGLRIRSVSSEELSSLARSLLALTGTNDSVGFLLDDILWAQLGFSSSVVGLKGSLGKTTRPLGLPLVSDDTDPARSDRAYWAALVGQQLRTVSTVLQALLELAAAAELAAAHGASPDDLVGRLLEASAQSAGDLGKTLPALAQAALAGKAEPGRLEAMAGIIGQRFGVAGPSVLAARQPVASVRTSLAAVAVTALGAGAAGHDALSALGAWFRAQARLSRFRAAVATLVSAPPDDRRIAVAETLDCASHRFDAWVSALPTRRLGQLRAGRPTGVLLGAYGWVHDLVPAASTARAGGYVHAPSLTHAATAGVLRSGYLTHNPDRSGSGALAIDLSSARVRRAVALLDGVRQGQPLGALLGYAIERRLHEHELDRYTLSLRALAPVIALRLSDRGEDVPQQATESIAANNVVDGVRLLGLDRGKVLAALGQAPADNIYLDQPGMPPWPVPTETEWKLIADALDEAEDSYAAVSDVLLAESVHQLVQGNTARAAAAMDAAAGGDAAPIDPDVIRTPTRASAVTQRVLVLLGDAPAGSGGWSASTPRAVAEPRLATWAEDRLGPAGRVVVQVAVDGTRTTLDGAGLAAVDLVFDSADGGTLERRLRAAIPALGPGPLAVRRDPAWPAGLIAVGELATIAGGLRAVITTSQPLRPASLGRPSDTPARTVDPSELATRLQPVVNEFQTAVTALAAAIEAIPPLPADVAAALDALRAYGLSLPPGAPMVAEATLAEGRRRSATVTALLAPPPPAPPVAVPPPLTPPPAVDPAAAAAQLAFALGEAVFGAGFAVLALVAPGSPDLFGASFDTLRPGRGPIRRWLRDLATVRPAVARYTRTLLLGDAGLGVQAGPRLAVAQLAPSGTAGASTWLGAALPAGVATPDQAVTGLVVEVPADYRPTVPVAGLVVDEWIEHLPRRDAKGRSTVTTGVALNASAPRARAPQVVLLAVSPDAARWTTDSLLDVVIETEELTRLRAVTLERSTLIGRILPAIQEQSWSLQGETALDLSTLATEISDRAAMVHYVKEGGP